MARQKRTNKQDVNMGPDEIGALKQLVDEFISRMTNVENELTLLKEDKKALVSEFSEKLDMETLHSVMRILKIKEGVQRKNAFDTFMEILSEQ